MDHFDRIMFGILVCVISIANLTQGAAIGAIAQNVHSDLLFFDAGLANALPNLPNSRAGKGINVDRFNVPAGGAIDLFYRYGFFSLSIRVVPRDDPGSWLVREPTSRVFDKNTITRLERLGPDSFFARPIEISLCDDVAELKEAYFRNFAAEGVAQPYRIFTGSWRLPTMARYFGLSVDVLDGNTAFVLIKMDKNTATIEVPPNGLTLSRNAAAESARIRPGDEDSVLNFIQEYGSHYVRSVTVGDSIYQVLALTPENMAELKRAVANKKQLNLQDWDRFYATYLAPWKVRETGNIQVASGDVRLQNFVEEQLRIQGQFGSYPNLVEGLVKRPEHVRMVEELGKGTSSVVSVDFASLKSFVGNNDIQTREFYDEIIGTHSALWESNL